MELAQSVIRHMTRLAAQHGAVNLAQGFTDEAPPYPMVWAVVTALLGGTDDGAAALDDVTVAHLLAGGDRDEPLSGALARLQNPRDTFSQYSYPFGRDDLRVAIADYTDRHAGFRPDPEREITVVLGATEGLASVLRALCEQGDGVIVIEPFHEMYPAQARVFGLRSIYVTLRNDGDGWSLDPAELERAAADGARLLVLNTPHNPSGKVFSAAELDQVAAVAMAHDLVVVTDEIYEQITFDGHRHVAMATRPGMRDRTVTINSISKTGNATGWRVGWVLAPEPLTTRIRAVHDTLVIQAPTPLQRAAVALLRMPGAFFERQRQGYTEKRALLGAALRDAGFRITPPAGAYYLFADGSAVPGIAGRPPMEAATALIEDIGVASVPGDNFYGRAPDGARYLRFAFCRGRESLEEAARRLRRLSSG